MTTIPKPGARTTTNTSTSSGGSSAPAYGSGQTQTYIGVPNDYSVTGPVPNPLGAWGIHAAPVQGQISPLYKTGDEYRQLPTNGADLGTLQESLIAAGYLSAADAARIVKGSPDPTTIAAFRKLLVTANVSGGSWRDALASRLAASAQKAPEVKQVPPLTITLDNPDDIKAVAQSTAQTLYGGNLPDADLNNLVTSYQGMQRASQTQAYNQQYDPAAGSYGPGGETTTPASVKTMTENLVKTQHPEQYQATQIGASLTKALDSLRNTGYL